MKFIGQIDHPSQLASLVTLGCEEVLICSETRSQEGGMNEAELKALLDQLKGEAIQVTLLLDRRIQENHWLEVLKFLDSPLARLRVMDLGLASELNERGLEFDLDLQVGHLNDRAIEVWLERMKQIRRAVLNPQIPRRQLLPFLGKMSVESELLGFGPIAMYHTPRRLLSWSEVDDEVEIQSDEMGAGSYPMKESQWGSTLYYNKILSLLPHLRELEGAGLSALRLDLRKIAPKEVDLLSRGLREGEDIRKDYPVPLLHGFYGENKSDSLLDKIGGRRSDISRKALAEVLDGRGRELLVRSLVDDWVLGENIFCEDGKGRSHTFIFEGGVGLEGELFTKPRRGDLMKLRASRKFPVGTFLYSQKGPEG